MRSSQHTEDSVGSLGSPHDSVACIRPGEDKTRIIGFAAEGVVPRAERTAHHHRDLGDGGVADGVHQFRPAADDSALLRVATYHESSNVLEENYGKTNLVAVHDKACRLVGTIGVDDTSHLNALRFRAGLKTLAGNDPDRPARNSCVGSDKRLAVVRFVFIK